MHSSLYFNCKKFKDIILWVCTDINSAKSVPGGLMIESTYGLLKIIYIIAEFLLMVMSFVVAHGVQVCSFDVCNYIPLP